MSDEMASKTAAASSSPSPSSFLQRSSLRRAAQPPAKDREPLEDPLLPRTQKVITPLNGRAHRLLVAVGRWREPWVEHPETIVQSRRSPSMEGAHSGGSELYCKWECIPNAGRFFVMTVHSSSVSANVRSTAPPDPQNNLMAPNVSSGVALAVQSAPRIERRRASDWQLVGVFAGGA